MKTRSSKASARTNKDRNRIRAIRWQFQSEKPSLEALLASGQYVGPIRAEDAWPIDQVLSRLKHLREKSGLTQRQLARKIGMDVTALSRIEGGRQPNVTMETLERLAKGLDCTLHVQVRPARKPEAA